METTVIEEQPIFMLRYSDFNTPSTHLEIYPSDLKSHDVGHEFAIYPDSNCGRDIHDEILRIVRCGVDVADAAENLIKMANHNGGKDNIGVVLVEVTQ